MTALIFADRDNEITMPGNHLFKFVSMLRELNAYRFRQAFDLTNPEDLAAAREVLDWFRYIHIFSDRPPAGGGITVESWVKAFDSATRAALTSPVALADAYVKTPAGMLTATPLDVAMNSVAATADAPTTLAAHIALRVTTETTGLLWVDGQHRGWLASIIESGLIRSTPNADGHTYEEPLFHAAGNRSWNDVIQFLHAGTTTAVITSTINESFPHAQWAAYPEPATRLGTRRFETATRLQRWESAELGLRQYTREAQPGLQLQPQTLHQPDSGEPGLTWTRLAELWKNNPT